ncbi:MAG: hypothetical protein KJ044_17090 [Planctomycetes bacterium]|nr:hypothetical protein [Planctomycetota bacterium]
MPANESDDTPPSEIGIMGMLVSLSGLSAVGKTYLINYTVEHSDFVYCPYITTRPRRPNEKNGIDRFFCSKEEFLVRQATGRLFAQQRFGYWYALDLEFLEMYKKGAKVILEIEYIYAAKLKGLFPSCHFLYIWPDTIQNSINRLRSRFIAKSETDQRLAEIQDEIDFVKRDKETQSPVFDYYFINDYSSESPSKFLDFLKDLELKRPNQS